MKTSIIFLICFLLGLGCIAAQPFAGRTKNKPLTKMTRSQVRNSNHGRTLYTSFRGKTCKQKRGLYMMRQRNAQYDNNSLKLRR